MSNNKQTMKLYTEEQLRNSMLSMKTYIKVYNESVIDSIIEKHIKALGEFELPSDEEISTSLCYYDLRNADGISQFKEDKEHYGLNDDDFKDLGNFAKKDCGCDNCFYGTHKLANYILKIQGGNK